jgi:hypothetical protein
MLHRVYINHFNNPYRLNSINCLGLFTDQITFQVSDGCGASPKEVIPADDHLEGKSSLTEIGLVKVD